MPIVTAQLSVQPLLLHFRFLRRRLAAEGTPARLKHIVTTAALRGEVADLILDELALRGSPGGICQRDYARRPAQNQCEKICACTAGRLTRQRELDFPR